MPTDFKRTEWNIWVWNNYNKAASLVERIYWQGLFV